MYVFFKKKQVFEKNIFVLNQYLIVQNRSVNYYFIAKCLTITIFSLTSYSLFQENAKNRTIKILS
jgi:hypothetical protein